MVTRNETAEAYGRRAAEYAELFGDMGSVHPDDAQLVGSWASTLGGRVLDAGCGPGQWTAFLAGRGVDAVGLDATEEFVRLAREAFTDTEFRHASFDELDAPSGSIGGILAWYSLIHHEPSTIDVPLAEFARVLRPGGGLLVGFFDGDRLEAFDHQVVTAWRWPLRELAERLEMAGFEVLETHRRETPGQRPHGAIVARRIGEVSEPGRTGDEA